MPIPLIPIIIAAAVAAASAAAIIAFNWENIKIFWKGKNLVILGTTDTGKSTLHDFLRKGIIREEKKGTKREKVNKKIYRLEDLEFVLKEGTDFGGQEDYRAEWAEEIEKSDICFYLFRTDQIYNNNSETIETVYTHLEFITNQIKKNNLPVNLILIGTFSDLIPDFEKLDDSNYQKFEEKIRKNLKDAIRVAKVKPSKIFIGSLKDRDKAERLIKEILVRIA